MDFEQRRDNEPSQPAGVGDGVAAILAVYGVEPSQKGARPEVEDDEDEPTGPRGASGEGPKRGGNRHRAAWDGAMLNAVSHSSTAPPGNRDALIRKYPALQNGVIR